MCVLYNSTQFIDFHRVLHTTLARVQSSGHTVHVYKYIMYLHVHIAMQMYMYIKITARSIKQFPCVAAVHVHVT